MADKCPKCGAEAKDSDEFSEHGLVMFGECGSTWTKAGILAHSNECKSAEKLYQRHQRLVEAARELIRKDRCSGTKYDCYYCQMDSGQGLDQHRADCPFYNLEKALETEPDNDQNPSDQGCPFDEHQKSEAKP